MPPKFKFTREQIIQTVLELTREFQMIKLYPEGAAEARLKISGVKKIFFYCNRDGLFYTDVN